MQKLRVALTVAALSTVSLVTTSDAEAQVFIRPPRVVVRVPAPPVVTIGWRSWRRPRVVRVAAPPVYYPPPVYYVPAPPPVYVPPPVQVVAPPPEPIYVAPQQLPPIPPPIVAPPPYTTYAAPPPAPVYVAPPAPVYVAPPAPAPVVVTKAKPTPQRAQLGLGGRVSGMLTSDKSSSVGGGGELLFRASPYVTLELAAEYQRSLRRSDTADSVTRVDIPLVFGTRVNLARAHWAVKPYVVGALGVDFAKQDLKVFTENATFFEYQAGGGFEFRIGQHVALTADGRFVGRARMDKAEQATLALKYIDQEPVRPLGNQQGGQFRVGVQAYF